MSEPVITAVIVMEGASRQKSVVNVWSTISGWFILLKEIVTDNKEAHENDGKLHMNNY